MSGKIVSGKKLVLSLFYVSFSIFFFVFLLLLCFNLTLALFPKSVAQKTVLTFLEGEGRITEEYSSLEVSHLQDVARVMQGARWLLYLSLLLVAITIWVFRSRKEMLAKLLRYGSLTTLLVVVLVGITAILNFEALFTSFHHLFFPQGNWQFPPDSLLIQTFPEHFFISVSRVTSIIAGSLSIIIYMVSKRPFFHCIASQ